MKKIFCALLLSVAVLPVFAQGNGALPPPVPKAAASYNLQGMPLSQVVAMARGMGVRVAARGSGAGSFINHLLGVSGVDAISQDLLMERFVSTLRPGLPDIDIDVESARRLEVYDAIFARFGSARTTCVSMPSKITLRRS